MAGYIARTKERWWFLTTIASSTLAPTVAEVGAGVLLTDATVTNPMIEPEGFAATATSVEAPIFGVAQVPKLDGQIDQADSSIRFQLDDTSNPLRTTLARGTSGYIVRAGPGSSVAAGLKVDVFPVKVSGNNKVADAGNVAASFRVAFSTPKISAEDIAVLA